MQACRKDTEFPLLGIHRDHGLLPPLELLDPPVDVLELSIAVGMPFPFAGLAIGLKAVIPLFQQTTDRVVTDPMTQTNQFVSEVARTLAGPQEWGLRVATAGRLKQGLQVLEQSRVLLA
jgi:hypothetical protein